jgi:putative ABC transport system permease protein
VSLARRNLFQDKTRLALSIGGVALAVMLILVLKGFLAGMNRQITSYLDYSPGSIVVAQEDVVNLLGATSLLPKGVDEKTERIRGVDEVHRSFHSSSFLNCMKKNNPPIWLDTIRSRAAGRGA